MPEAIANSPRLEMRGVRRSFGATKALRGVELSGTPSAFWTAVASEARHRFGPGAFVFQNVLSHAKAPSSLRFAGAVQDTRVPAIARPTIRTLSQNRTL
jgi:hypothetical protein